MNRNCLLGLILLIFYSVSAQDTAKLDNDNDFAIENISAIKVYIENDRWLSTLDSLKQVGNDDRILGSVVYDGVRYDSVGIRFKGNSSYFNVRNQELTKLPFNIKANFKIKKQRFKGKYRSLKLSNVFRDPSFLREVLSYEIAGNYMPSPRANFVKLYVNDEYLGLYNSTESVDKDFLKKHFDYSKGVLFKCDPNWNAVDLQDCPKGDKASLQYLGQDSTCYYSLYEIKSDDGWGELIKLTHALNKDIDQIEKVLNVDQVLWMHAYNNVLVNLDSYAGRLCHNYYLYQDKFGVFNPIPWDMNMSFGGFRYDGLGSPLPNSKMVKLSMFNHYKQKNKKRPLITNLLSQPLYRKLYVAHVKTIVEDYFANKKYLNRAKSIQSTISNEVFNDKNKLYSFEGFKLNIDSTASIGKSKMIGIAQLMEPRTAYLTQHPLYTRAAPEVSDVNHKVQTDLHVIKAKVLNAETVFLAYRQKKHAPFQRIKMTPDINGVYSASVDKKKRTEYYIIAEGDKSAAVSPRRAAFEFYTIE